MFATPHTTRTAIANEIREFRNELAPDGFSTLKVARFGKLMMKMKREQQEVPVKETLGQHWPIKAHGDCLWCRTWDTYGESKTTVMLFTRDMTDEEVGSYYVPYYRGPGQWFGGTPHIERAPGRTLVRYSEGLDI